MVPYSYSRCIITLVKKGVRNTKKMSYTKRTLRRKKQILKLGIRMTLNMLMLNAILCLCNKIARNPSYCCLPEHDP